MFYRLAFPDKLRLEKLQERTRNTADALSFLEEMQADLEQDRALEDLRSGWVKYLTTDMALKGESQSRKRTSQRHARNRSPTQSEEDAAVRSCLLSLIYQPFGVHMMVPCHVFAGQRRFPCGQREFRPSIRFRLCLKLRTVRLSDKATSK